MSKETESLRKDAHDYNVLIVDLSKTLKLPREDVIEILILIRSSERNELLLRINNGLLDIEQDMNELDIEE